ncbi:MAG: hypothetical protein K0S39_2534 [Paenibacillus sp.]|jgi:hypothetical protein|nr:hypothetical protein [Paenibacillus sp.]
MAWLLPSLETHRCIYISCYSLSGLKKRPSPAVLKFASAVKGIYVIRISAYERAFNLITFHDNFGRLA